MANSTYIENFSTTPKRLGDKPSDIPLVVLVLDNKDSTMLTFEIIIPESAWLLDE